MSWISSSFVQKIQFLSVTYSLLWGIGAGLANYSSTIIIQQSFHEHLSLANGLASSGTGIGTLVLGQLLTELLERFGYKWTFRVCALVPCIFALQLCSHHISQTTSDSEVNSALTASMVDVGESNINKANKLLEYTKGGENLHYKKTNISNEMASTKKSFKLKELFHKDLWHNMKFIIFVGGVSIFLFGAFIPFIFLVSCSTTSGSRGVLKEIRETMLIHYIAKLIFPFLCFVLHLDHQLQNQNKKNFLILFIFKHHFLDPNSRPLELNQIYTHFTG